jgi:hypothetical protein
MGEFTQQELNAMWSAQRAAEARHERWPDEPSKFAKVLGTQSSGLPGRSQPCARCSRTTDGYERRYPKDASPPILEAASYYRNGVRYWLANCEPCSEKEFLRRWSARIAAAEDPQEPAISQNERAKRIARLAKLQEEKRLYYEGKREREAMAAHKTSGAAAAAAPTSRHLGLGTATIPETAPGESGSVGRAQQQDASMRPLDYATKRAREPSESFADWWDRQ